MATVRRLIDVDCDGFRVLDARGTLGWVEETWLGPAEETAAFAVRLADGRRGLLVANEVAAVLPEDEAVVASREARLLRLEPPHLDATGPDGVPAASWRAAGDPLDLPEASRSRRKLLPARRPQLLQPRVTVGGERPLWLTLVLLYASLTAIVLAVIALDVVLSYVFAGHPPY